MNQIKEILIDLREEFELLNLQLTSTDPTLLIMNIPSRAIFSNIDWINEVSNLTPIYVMCRSGVRSKKIKNKYFKNNDNVKSIDGGIKKIEDSTLFKNRVKIIMGSGGLGLQQYMQLVFICMLLFILLLLYSGINTKYIMLFILLMILFIGYQIYTQSCFIGAMIPLSEINK